MTRLRHKFGLGVGPEVRSTVPKMPDSPRRVYRQLWTWQGEGRAYTCNRELAETLNMSERDVKRSLGWLDKAGYIDDRRRIVAGRAA